MHPDNSLGARSTHIPTTRETVPHPLLNDAKEPPAFSGLTRYLHDEYVPPEEKQGIKTGTGTNLTIHDNYV